jgi:tetrahydromethanopterin S-methyltransferase subunit G
MTKSKRKKPDALDEQIAVTKARLERMRAECDVVNDRLLVLIAKRIERDHGIKIGTVVRAGRGTKGLATITHIQNKSYMDAKDKPWVAAL